MEPVIGAEVGANLGCLRRHRVPWEKQGGRAAPKYSRLLSHLHSLGATLGDPTLPRATFRGWPSIILAFWSDNEDAEQASRASLKP